MPDSCRCARSLLRATERIHSAPLHGEDTYGLAGWRRDATTQKRFAQKSRGKSEVIFRQTYDLLAKRVNFAQNSAATSPS